MRWRHLYSHVGDNISKVVVVWSTEKLANNVRPCANKQNSSLCVGRHALGDFPKLANRAVLGYSVGTQNSFTHTHWSEDVEGGKRAVIESEDTIRKSDRCLQKYIPSPPP